MTMIEIFSIIIGFLHTDLGRINQYSDDVEIEPGTHSHFFHYLFPNSALFSVLMLATVLGYLHTTLCRGMIRTHGSRVAPDWDI